jgi:hypothetical protein
MTQTQLLIGSLSSDLYRVANMVGKGSFAAADRFFLEAKKWSSQLSGARVKNHISKIIFNINEDTSKELTLEKAEKLLMYSVLLQNYVLHSSER